MFKAHDEATWAKQRVGELKRSITKATNDGYKAKNPRDREFYRNRTATLRQMQKEAEEEAAAAVTKEKSFKGTKAPGYGEWKSDPDQKHGYGSGQDYIVPDHSEYGRLNVVNFSGFPMQKVPPSSTVKYEGSERTWSGKTATNAARKFTGEVFGLIYH